MPRPTRLFTEPLEDRWVPATLTVDGDGGRQFTTISAAISAAGHDDIIQVFKATNGYSEVVNIPASKPGLKIVGQEPGVLLKSPTSVTPDFQGGDALIDVRAVGAEIRNLALDGSTNTDGDLNSGIRVIDGGSATIRDNTIRGLRTAANSQFGIGVQVGGSSLGTINNVGTASVEHNVITDYSGAGVIVDGAGSSADVRDNIITGRGGSNPFAQYGVQLSFGATGRIERNTITNNNSIDSGGILIYQVAGKNNVVSGNRIDNNDIGIWLYQTDGTATGTSVVQNNTVINSGFSGILIDSSSNVSIKNNQVSRGTGDGIGVYDSSNTAVENNEISKNDGDGIFVFGGSGTQVKNNKSFSNGGYGLHLFGAPDTFVNGNVLNGNVSGSIRIE